jgi:regulator of protease activity HflC (stomatin/prohibitin superfamily)
MFLLIVGLVLLGVAAVLFAMARRRDRALREAVAQAETTDTYGRGMRIAQTYPELPWLRYGSWALAAVAVLAIVFSCVRFVGTKEIGVPTTFGKVGTTHYGAGPHIVAPWVSLHQMDAAIQTDDHLGKNQFAVRIANQQTGYAEVSLQWSINPAYVDFLYQNYRSFDHVKQQLVDRKLFASVNEALGDYNPLADVGTSTQKSRLVSLQGEIFRLMQAKVKTIDGDALIRVRNVQLPIIHFDKETQSRINQLQQQVALTRIATQEKLTNENRAKANTALATKSLSTQVLVSRCLDTFEQMVKTKQPVPAGLSCWPGGGVAGVIAK